MPNAFVSLVLVVLCAAAYMHFFQPSVSTVNIQSIIDQRVKEAGGPKYATKLDLVSASKRIKHETREPTINIDIARAVIVRERMKEMLALCVLRRCI